MKTRIVPEQRAPFFVRWVRKFISQVPAQPAVSLQDRISVFLDNLAPEVKVLLSKLEGTAKLMAEIIYGGGLRVMECCRLRVKDLDFDGNLIFVRAGKGGNDRSTLLPQAVKPALAAHLERVKALHEKDLSDGYLGHSHVETTMIYTHVVKDLRNPAVSPLDRLPAD